MEHVVLVLLQTQTRLISKPQPRMFKENKTCQLNGCTVLHLVSLGTEFQVKKKSCLDVICPISIIGVCVVDLLLKYHNFVGQCISLITLHLVLSLLDCLHSWEGFPRPFCRVEERRKP